MQVNVLGMQTVKIVSGIEVDVCNVSMCQPRVGLSRISLQAAFTESQHFNIQSQLPLLISCHIRINYCCLITHSTLTSPYDHQRTNLVLVGPHSPCPYMHTSQSILASFLPGPKNGFMKHICVYERPHKQLK